MDPRNGERLLVAQSDPTLVKLVADILEVEGYPVTQALDGKEALTHLDQTPFSVIILGGSVAGISTADLIFCLKDDPETASIPIIMLTSAAESVLELCGLKHRPDYYLKQPFDAHDLCELVEQLLRERNTVVTPDIRTPVLP